MRQFLNFTDQISSIMSIQKILLFVLATTYIVTAASSQSKVMTPEQLIELKRVSAIGLSKDGKRVIYQTSTFDLTTNERSSQSYAVSVNGGTV